MDNHIPILKQSAQYLKGVGPQKIKSLHKVRVFSVKDLLYYLPRRHEDRGNFKAINKVTVGNHETVRGKVLTMGLRRLKGRRTIFQLAVGDATGIIYATWFNQPYLEKNFSVGDDVILYGKVDRFRVLQINSPEYEIMRVDEDDSPLHTGRIVPIYPGTAELSQRYLRKTINACLEKCLSLLEEYLPADILKRHNLLPLARALSQIHFPENFAVLEAARARLIFDEFFLLQLALAIKRRDIKECRPGIAFKKQGKKIEQFRKSLNFELTASQKQVIAEIEEDMSADKPMNRLLQGDVGSGKTIVCVWAIVICIQNGYQAALMVPTEILARQHFMNLEKMLAPLGITLGLLSSSLKKGEKTALVKKIKSRKIDLVVGTHALIQDDVAWKKLGLIVVDEQHKFGVAQRAALQKKALMPDVLVMSATPIPRTLAVTLYGDLDVSTIHELPPGRIPVETYWISEKKRLDLYAFLRKKIKEKNQVYVVYPVVEKSRVADLKAATKMFEHFRDSVFPEFKSGLLHGRMKEEQKREVMEKFQSGGIDILVATTVIEVGIDVPNASIILIEHAERFGLSQLHQLRGRVGRGKQKAYCVLLSSGQSEEAAKRLGAMTKTSDGFKIAEYDLLLRGPGEFFGTRQSGIPELKIGDIIHDREALLAARKEAFDYLSARSAGIADNDPVIAKIKELFPQSKEFLLVR